MNREILNSKQACEFLNCSRSSLYKFMEDPSFPVFQEEKRGKLLFTRISLRNWVTDRLRGAKVERAENVVDISEARKKKISAGG